MNKPFILALFGLAVLLGNVRHFACAQELEKAKKLHDGWATFHHQYLVAMKEPVLWRLAQKDRTATVYRFLWLPSFHDPISVRFVKSDDGVVLFAVRLKLDREYQPRQIVASKTIKLSRSHWERIARHLNKAKFWTLPTHKRRTNDSGIDCDGDHLIVEGVKDGTYHIVERSCPGKGGDFVDLCQAMLFMSGIDVRNVWFDYRG